jgi:hypothetical protein
MYKFTPRKSSVSGRNEHSPTTIYVTLYFTCLLHTVDPTGMCDQGDSM